MAQLSDLLRWCSESTLIVFIRDSSYGMPAVQSVHLVGMTVLLGAVFLLDVRLARLGMTEWSARWLERELRPWAIAALTLVLLSGALIFVGTPAKYLASNPFRFKMAMLALATAFHFGLLRRFARSETGRPRSIDVLAAGVSLTLWFAVGWAGRAIAFVP